jgi:predicted branched-subunit amino acid permease
MSLSLSQKLDDGFNLPKRMITAFGITDEIFTVASLESKKVTFPYMCGLICTPVLGWTLGTFFGAVISNALPALLSSAMGIALYGMFMAIIIPPARKSSKVLTVILMAVLFTCIMKYVPFLGFISSGFRVIIATILAAGIGAFIFPVEDKE